MAMIEMQNVSKWYGNFRVLTERTTAVDKGEVVVVCGPSGSGKSTLIKTVNGLEPFQEGTIIVDGVSVGEGKTDLPKLRSNIGMVFQNFELFPHISIIENIKLGQMKVLGRGDEESDQRSMELLERIGLADQAAKFPAQLSGGQQQRVGKLSVAWISERLFRRLIVGLLLATSLGLLASSLGPLLDLS